MLFKCSKCKKFLHMLYFQRRITEKRNTAKGKWESTQLQYCENCDRVFDIKISMKNVRMIPKEVNL